ncbi:uncharacterized protein LOC129222649 [Uloborus diversus]|uniref:uncharacterized protein LOC129222649 n=1 Tax=Uloborus diversus TaxID=327109 RepID=UPI0024099C5C|nr:uncharacterized protein LOC129222649 [Uloborus diversus]
MYSKIVYSLFLCVHLSLGDTEICTSQTPCKCILDKTETIDISSLGAVTYPRFHNLGVESSNGLYSYNPCFPFDSADKDTSLKEGNIACTKSAGCVIMPGGSDGELPESHSIGYQETAKFGKNADSDNYKITYSVPNAKQSLVVNLICNDSIENHLVVVDPESEGNFKIVMNLTSKCACVNGCKSAEPKADASGLSTGSKLLIAFFTILLAYLIVGIVWNFFNGARGSEVIPNADFWNDLPKLILEGVLFTCSCCGKRTSYGEV